VKKKRIIIISVIVLFGIITVGSVIKYVGANGLGNRDRANSSDITTATITAETQNVADASEDNDDKQDQIPELTKPPKTTEIPQITEIVEITGIPQISGIPQGSDDTTVDIEESDVYDTITISAAGDVTLGRDLSFGYEKTFDQELELQSNDYGYFFRNVKDIFAADDLTIVNLETTLTTATKMAEKKYRFKADPSYVEILKEGNIEVVSIANNHTLDYLDKGYEDTLSTLEAARVGYFGFEHSYITDIRGIKIGILGYTYWETSKKQKEKIKKAIASLREEGADIVIVMYHWGFERDYEQYSSQQDLAHFSIDNGADLILGSHPHVVQGIEEYNGKYIVYSLGNFSFGGNKNPDDKDTMIIVHKFNFKNNELLSQENEIIPCSISSIKERNNYQPTPLEGEEKERVRKKIEKYSDY